MMKRLPDEQKDGLIRSVMGLTTPTARIHLRRLIDRARAERVWSSRRNVVTEAVREEMRRIVRRRGLSMRKIAGRAGTTNGYVSQVLSGKRGASATMAKRIWEALR